MSTHNICFLGEIRKNISIFGLKKASYQELWKGVADERITQINKFLTSLGKLLVLLKITGIAMCTRGEVILMNTHRRNIKISKLHSAR